MAYRIEWAPIVRRQLRLLTARERALVVAAADSQLRHEPFVETRNRKPRRSKDIAAWELRVQHLRIFYDAVGAEARRVLVTAVGRKIGADVIIAFEESAGETHGRQT